MVGNFMFTCCTHVASHVMSNAFVEQHSLSSEHGSNGFVLQFFGKVHVCITGKFARTLQKLPRTEERVGKTAHLLLTRRAGHTRSSRQDS